MEVIWIVYKKEHIYGEYHTKEKAVDYMMDLWFDGVEGVKIKKITIDEYKKMCYNNINKRKRGNKKWKI